MCAYVHHLPPGTRRNVRNLENAQFEVVVKILCLALAETERNTCLVIPRVREALGVGNACGEKNRKCARKEKEEEVIP